MTNETKRGRGRPKGTTKPTKGKMVWIPAELKNAVLAYIELLKQQQGLKP